MLSACRVYTNTFGCTLELMSTADASGDLVGSMCVQAFMVWILLSIAFGNAVGGAPIGMLEYA